jgi:hypothetical protein
MEIILALFCTNFECIYTKKETVSHMLQKVKILQYHQSQFESHQVLRIEVGIDLSQKPSFYVTKNITFLPKRAILPGTT